VLGVSAFIFIEVFIKDETVENGVRGNTENGHEGLADEIAKYEAYHGDD